MLRGSARERRGIIADLMEGILDYIDSMNPAWIYGALLIAAYLENIIPPIPGDTVVIFGAYLVGTGRIDFTASVLLTTLGSTAGFMTFYTLGRYVGREYFERKNYKWFSRESFNKVDAWFKRRGLLIVAVNRFLAGTRSVVSIFAGFTQMNWLKVMLLALVSSALWNGILITAGFYAGSNWQNVREAVSGYNIVITIVIISAVLIALFVWLRGRRSPAAIRESE